ncbi:MAG: TIR domain-containing protein [Anaerolineae bacterium]|nr:TIR domain-containing protein [Anaerolineae bacterium]
MPSKPQIFISYKTGVDNSLTFVANTIRDFLKGEGYAVWMDTTSLIAGDEWPTQIYEAIAKSDLVLLLLAKETGVSDWVRREIDVARGARVYVLPVLIQDTHDDVKSVLEMFDLPKVQTLTFKENSETERSKLLKGIEISQPRTRERQEEWLVRLQADRKSVAVLKERYNPTTKSYASYTLPGKKVECKIHLAAGDMTRMRGVDVLVNTENNYMQMARVFETFSLSCNLRLCGSLLNKSGFIVEDTVQEELYEQIKHEYPIPISMGVVIPTHAGHAESRLVKSGARYIFHVAAVSVAPNSKDPIRPLDDAEITAAITNTLNAVKVVNEARGVISPVGSTRREQEKKVADKYQSIQSIILPLFATGRGGREQDIGTVAQQMIEATREYMADEDNADGLTLKDIHLCAYSELDVATVKAVMDDLFSR